MCHKTCSKACSGGHHHGCPVTQAKPNSQNRKLVSCQQCLHAHFSRMSPVFRHPWLSLVCSHQIKKRNRPVHRFYLQLLSEHAYRHAQAGRQLLDQRHLVLMDDMLKHVAKVIEQAVAQPPAQQDLVWTTTLHLHVVVF
jgi:hypothetical protein